VVWWSELLTTNHEVAGSISGCREVPIMTVVWVACRNWVQGPSWYSTLMDAPTSEVGYTLTTTSRKNHEIYMDVWWHWKVYKVLG
jgi:hypothetical protein